MKDLKLEISVLLSEHTDEKVTSFFNVLSKTVHNRIIDKEIRERCDDLALRNIVEMEIRMGFDFAKRDLISKLTLPLNMGLENTKNKIESDLSLLIPGFRFSTYFSEGVFNIYRICINPYVGETIEITHPKQSDQYLTTKYMAMRDKLEDGTWTYGYQCSNFYEEVIERIPAPFDESILIDYFKKSGIQFKLPAHPIKKMPDPKPIEDSESNYD